MKVARALGVVLIVAFGIAWAIRSAIGLQDPDYWDPVTDLDYAAVWWYSIALALSAGVIGITGWLARRHRPSVLTATLVGGGLLLAAVANAFEDGLAMKWLGTIYVIGAVIGGYGLFVLAGAYAVAGAPLLSVVALGTVIGMMLHGSIGGFLVLGVSLWFAERLVRRPESLAPGPEANPRGAARDQAV